LLPTGATITAASPARESHPFSQNCKNEGLIMTAIATTATAASIAATDAISAIAAVLLSSSLPQSPDANAAKFSKILLKGNKIMMRMGRKPHFRISAALRQKFEIAVVFELSKNQNMKHPFLQKS